MGIFSKNDAPAPHIKRNTFDMSFQNNLTMKMGLIYPCFCKEVIPGDSVKIDTAFGLRFMPLLFPLQTKMRADVHFFYVRNRNLYEDWQDFIGNTVSNLVPPTLSPDSSARQCKTGSLGDYLGVPSTVVGSNLVEISADAEKFAYPGASSFLTLDLSSIGTDHLAKGETQVNFVNGTGGKRNAALYWATSINTVVGGTFKSGMTVRYSGTTTRAFSEVLTSNLFYLVASTTSTNPPAAPDYVFFDNVKRGSVSVTDADDTSDMVNFSIEFVFDGTGSISTGSYGNFFILSLSPDAPNGDLDQTALNQLTFTKVSSYLNNVVEYGKEFPVALSALPFRAYESIYNAFFRDQRNNPYLVDGVNKPNVYIPSKKGGVDLNSYELRRRNWEQDFLTSALPTPQQGVAPLVGITSTGVATFSDNGVNYQVQMQTAEDGDTITGATYTSDIPNSVARSLVDVVNSGISINDFRAVNSLQRWLETNMRRGLKYKDQILSHFGVKTSYAELDMPEFLGGVSQMVDIQQINQTSAPTSASGVGSDPLGSYAGQASVVGGNNHTIHHYCDEHGFIIGVISVVPVPCYSQLLPKFFTKKSTLDYFFPEFGHIGLQPIPYREVAPLQVDFNGENQNATFGYQRAWYDYLASTDEVHGLFRKAPFNSFLLSRVFDRLPSLTPEFLTVNEDQLNDVFAVSSKNSAATDTILGQIHFKALFKRPIPRYGIPRLE